MFTLIFLRNRIVPALNVAEVPKAGVEPARLAAHGPEPCLSASSSTLALCLDINDNNDNYIIPILSAFLK